jgi:type II secretion system protein G
MQPKTRVLRVSRFSKGFTLIELLIVIAIIGLLAAIVLTSLEAAKVKSRNSVRLQNIQTIGQVLEMYNIDKGHYPITNGWTTSCDKAGLNWIPDNTDYSWSIKYLYITPRDPKEVCTGSSANSYAYWSDGSSFKLMTTLEGSLAPQTQKGVGGADGGQDNGMTQTGTTLFYDGSSFQLASTANQNTHFTVTFTSEVTDPTNVANILITATFSSIVDNFALSQLITTNISAATNLVRVLASVYTFMVTPSSEGPITVSLQAGTVTDVYGGTNSQGGYSTTFESQRIHISLSPDPYASTVSGPFVVHINFTIAPTNFNSSKITAINATVTVLNQIGSDGKNFDATFTPTSRGSIQMYIPEGVLIDVAGNDNVYSNIITTTY